MLFFVFKNNIYVLTLFIKILDSLLKSGDLDCGPLLARFLNYFPLTLMSVYGSVINFVTGKCLRIMKTFQDTMPYE